MVSIHEADSDALRFLWVDDVQKSSPVIQELQFTRVVFGVSASHFLLNATISYHLEKNWDMYPPWCAHFCILCTLMMSHGVKIVKTKPISCTPTPLSYLRKVALTYKNVLQIWQPS